MRFRNLDLNLLAALDTLLRVRNVSRAAEEMFITQSAMSNALGRLREYFDDPLLIQVGRSMELSPLAISLEQPLRDIIVRIEAAVESSPTFEPAEATRAVSFVVSDFTLLTIVPRFVEMMAAQAPGIQLHFKPQQNAPHLLLERGEADLLIAPTIFCSANHPSERLVDDTLCCVVSEDSPFPGTRMAEDAFLSAGHVAMLAPNGGESFASRACREAGLAVKVDVTTFSFASLPLLVRGTKRIAVVQRRLVECMVGIGGIRIMEPPFALQPLRQSVQWHSHRSRDPALIWIRQQLHEAVKVWL
ncbi:LysR substrate-binding domain-containing protein [Allorhizobium undicola]|uniref:LysR substrate-binding domain-containing protein n=1 Tax=Allorhizobium undicola TaxID=78527 RepID=UPI0004830A42|nr:LysR substrate-binding domain-containing protein [Allorhizobium undicola]